MGSVVNLSLNSLSLKTKVYMVVALSAATGSFGFLAGVRINEGGLTPNRAMPYVGATYIVSGVCVDYVKQKQKVTLSEEQLKITSVEESAVSGVLRASKQAVICDQSKIAIEKMSLSAMTRHFTVVPNVTVQAQEEQKEEKPAFLSLSQKMLKYSGTCKNDAGIIQSPVVDSYLDVSDVRELGDTFEVSGIDRVSNERVMCLGSEIKYEVVTSMPEKHTAQQVAQQTAVDLKGKIILVDSDCFLHRKLKGYVKPGQPKRFGLANTKVQVIDYRLDNGEMTYLAGTLMDGKDAGVSGTKIECEKEHFPILYKTFNQNETTLEPIGKGGVNVN